MGAELILIQPGPGDIIKDAFSGDGWVPGYLGLVVFWAAGGPGIDWKCLWDSFGRILSPRTSKRVYFDDFCNLAFDLDPFREILRANTQGRPKCL